MATRLPLEASPQVIQSPSSRVFDIAELGELIFQHLSTHDLTQCARVNKNWHALSASGLWRDPIRSGMTTRLLCELTLKDYHHHVAWEEDYETGQHSQESPTASLPSLTKYGGLIQWLPDPVDLPRELGDVIHHQQALLSHSVEVTAHGLVLHLFKQCPVFRIRRFSLHFQDLKFGDWMTIVEFVIPRVQDLSVYTPFGYQHTSVPKLASLMDRCLDTLEILTLTAGISYTDDDTFSGTYHKGDGSKCWTFLKELTVTCYQAPSNPTVFWAWLLERCRNVRTMKVDLINGSTQGVAECMLEHMPCLDKIEIQIRPNPAVLNDDGGAILLDGSREGWKVVKLNHPAVLKQSTMNALLKHSSTLEKLYVDSGSDVTSNDLVQVLASCRNLRSLNDAPNLYAVEDSRRIHANVFIDRDRDTGALRAWECEASLKKLRIKIKGIPRPGAEGLKPRWRHTLAKV